MNDTTTEIDFKKDDETYSLLEKTLREGALKMLQQALEIEIQQFLDKHSSKVDVNGHRVIVRNGYHPERNIITGIGPFSVKVPRVDDRKLPPTDERFTSSILPKYLRKVSTVDNLLPVLYLKGISSNGFQDALVSILGEGAKGLSASYIIRLKKSWEDDYNNWSKRSLEGKEYAYIWVDGKHFNIRLEDERSCILVIMGADKNGNKELIAVEDGFRESELSWKEMLESPRSRGLTIAPR